MKNGLEGSRETESSFRETRAVYTGHIQGPQKVITLVSTESLFFSPSKLLVYPHLPDFAHAVSPCVVQFCLSPSSSQLLFSLSNQKRFINTYGRPDYLLDITDMECNKGLKKTTCDYNNYG